MDWDKLAALERDYDTYGALPPAREAIEAARDFCERYKVVNASIGPGSEGSVAVTWLFGETQIMIEFYGDGSVVGGAFSHGEVLHMVNKEMAEE